MSNYGPPGGPYPGQPPQPYPGQPPQPWPDRRTEDPFGPPSTDHDPTWTTSIPHPPPKRGRRWLIPALIVVAALLCGGGGLTAYLLSRSAAPPVSQPTTAPSAERPNEEPPPSAEPAASPAAESSTDVRFVVAGQCVRNEGDRAEPKLVITECAPEAYEVLKRFDGITTGRGDAEKKCARVTGYTDWYFFDSPLDTLDYVLCLKLR